MKRTVWTAFANRTAGTAAAALFLAAAALCAGDAEAYAFPGRFAPSWNQYRLDEVAEIPSETVDCPVCGVPVAVLMPEKLIRGGETGEWEMWSPDRDADSCPHPRPGLVGFHAEIAVCPHCGFAAYNSDFRKEQSAETRQWVAGALTPGIRGLRSRLAGKAGGEAADEFLSRQENIPDVVRCEYARACYEAAGAPNLLVAKLSRLAAGAYRRELPGLNADDFLARQGKKLAERIARGPGAASPPGAQLDFILRRLGAAGANRFDYGERQASRLLAAALYARLGLYGHAETMCGEAAAVGRESFSRPERDPFWSFTAGSRDRRRELGAIRSGLAGLAGANIARIGRERTHLRLAAESLAAAMEAGELDGDPEGIAFHAYLKGEFHRRLEEFPEAALWLEAAAEFASASPETAKLAARQLDLTRLAAGEKGKNLLPPPEKDLELLEKIRENAEKTRNASS